MASTHSIRSLPMMAGRSRATSRCRP
ncbi:CRISPR-associated DxTHG motif protein [Bradyrhizobium sp.]